MAAAATFAGVDLGRAAAPDETSILRFSYLVEVRDLCGRILDTINLYLDGKGIRISTGTLVDDSIIPSPSSIKNASGERDPELHQTKKGQQHHFGAKTHIGGDSKEEVVHSVCTSVASVADERMLPDLLYGREKKVWRNGGCQGHGEVIRAAAPEARDVTCRMTKFKGYVDEGLSAGTGPSRGCGPRWSGSPAS